MRAPSPVVLSRSAAFHAACNDPSFTCTLGLFLGVMNHSRAMLLNQPMDKPVFNPLS
ncbi:MAG: hypothetical protein JOY54_06855 [Acidobacteriaceae bacterium]|nr:hypothetical protein [Acidobacteriaceae bacterium]